MPIHLVGKLFHSISDVFIHWYVGGFLFVKKTAISVLRTLDRSFAVRVSFENIFNPLYQDRSLIGYVLGFILRLFKIVTGGVVYIILMTLFLAFYLVWAIIPLYVLSKIIGIDAKNIFKE